MNELSKYRRVLTMLTLYFLALCFLVAAFLPSYRSIALGLILGSSVSLINVIYLGYRVRKVTEAVASGKAGKRSGLGFGVRAALSILVVFVAMKKPEYFNVIAVAGSLVLAQFLILFIGFGFSRKEN
ncbi:ATP synthase subunit I [Paenibacillus sediminis]|uniref:ATP synthase protein I n=1 Tax=Paenibacillus sediminis TaxID=664909 RepID=A0ABS4H2D9_9BACL|nr:ATP synthase subunit I [Paenibacillus sediminis]MBP1936704.1 ATP synthase protein I [Paenibacillus sediminis]